MFKSKTKLWIFVLVISFIFYKGNFINSTIKFINKNIEEKKEKEFTLSVDKNSNIDNNIIYNFEKIKIDDNNPDIIITRSNNSIENYELIKNSIYSPIIFAVKNNISKDSEGFQRIGKTYTINLKLILESIEKDKTWEAIGIKNKNNVKLLIPNIHNPYYKDIIDLMILTLNDFKEPNEDELKVLYHRVLNIVSKCDTYNYLSNELNNEFILIPEYLFSQNEYLKYNYTQMIPNKTTSLKYNMLIKKGRMKDLNNMFNKNSIFIKETGFRNIFFKEKDYCEVNNQIFQNNFILIYDNNLSNNNYIDITINKETINKETINKETIDKETINKETINKETIDKETINKETINKETIDKETINKETINKETINKETIDKETIDKETINKETINKETIDKETIDKKDIDNFSDEIMPISIIIGSILFLLIFFNKGVWW